MPSTPRGITYPDSSGHTRLWEHLQALADTADDALDALITGTSGDVVLGAFRLQWGSDTASAAGVGAGALATDTVTFSTAFSANPVCWAIINGFVSGSTAAVLKTVDTISTTGARAVFLNTSASAATYTNLPYTWFAIGLA